MSRRFQSILLVALLTIFLLNVIPFLNPFKRKLPSQSLKREASLHEDISALMESEDAFFDPPSRTVHSLWVGDSSKMDTSIVDLWRTDHKLIIHTSLQEIFRGLPALWKKAHDTSNILIVQTDYLKLMLLYKYGGVVTDIDTSPNVPIRDWQLKTECNIFFTLELKWTEFQAVQMRSERRDAMEYVRPFQILAWTYYAKHPKNKHVKNMIRQANARIFGRQDIDATSVQEISGSGMTTDYIANLFEEHGIDFVDAMKNLKENDMIAVDGLCVMENHFRDKYITHHYLNSWRS